MSCNPLIYQARSKAFYSTLKIKVLYIQQALSLVSKREGDNILQIFISRIISCLFSIGNIYVVNMDIVLLLIVITIHININNT